MYTKQHSVRPASSMNRPFGPTTSANRPCSQSANSASLFTGRTLLSTPQSGTVSTRDPDSKDIFVCSYCGDVLASKSGYQTHVRRHEGQYRFFCDICNKGFMIKPDYEGHMNVHMNLRPFKCDFCDKTFPYKRSHVKHRATCPSRTTDDTGGENSTLSYWSLHWTYGARAIDLLKILSKLFACKKKQLLLVIQINQFVH